MGNYQRRDVITGGVAVAAVAALGFYGSSRGGSDDGAGETAAGDDPSDEPDRQAEPGPQPEPTTSSVPDEVVEEPPPSTEPEVLVDAAPPIEVICRDAWRAAAAEPGMVEHRVERLTIHHTAVTVERPADGPRSILSHQTFHQGDKGWPDIAYHFLIDPAGNIYEGRDPVFRGDTATAYDPTGHFLVCIDGNFDSTDVNEAQLAAAAKVLAYGAGRFGVPLSTLAGHRDYAQTSCPGDAIYAKLTDGSLAAAAQAVLDGGVPEIVLTCDDAGDALIDQIESTGA